MFLEKTSEDCFDYLLSLPKLQARFFRMFYFSLFQRLIDWESPEDKENLINLQKSPTMLRELLDLLSFNLDSIDFVDQSLSCIPDCPLDVHCSYSRDQILLALDFEKPNTVREGVKWLPEKKLDLLFVTLNKSDKEYSPSTMYQDYSLNEDLSLAEPECHFRYFRNRKALYSAQNAGDKCLFIRSRMEKKRPWGRSLYLSWPSPVYLSYRQ